MKISLYFIKNGQPDDVLSIDQSEWADTNLFTVRQEEKRSTKTQVQSTVLNASGVLEYVANLFNLIQYDEIDAQDEIQLTCPGVPPILFQQKNLYQVKEAVLHRIELTLTHKPVDHQT